MFIYHSAPKPIHLGRMRRGERGDDFFNDEEILFRNEIASIEQAFHYNPLGEGEWVENGNSFVSYGNNGNNGNNGIDGSDDFDLDEEEIVF